MDLTILPKASSNNALSLCHMQIMAGLSSVQKMVGGGQQKEAVVLYFAMFRLCDCDGAFPFLT